MGGNANCCMYFQKKMYLSSVSHFPFLSLVCLFALV